MDYYLAVLHIKSKTDYKKVGETASKVTKGLTDNVTVFPNPSPAVSEIKASNDLLHELSIKALGGGHADIVARDAQSVVVHALLKEELIYVNSIAKGDKAIILLSGFDCNCDRTPHPIPDKVIIKRVVSGIAEHSAKIYIESVPFGEQYWVEKSTNPSDDKSWETVGVFLSIHILEVFNLTRAQEISLRVAAGNSAGWGEWSEPVSFISK